MKNTTLFTAALAALAMFASCQKEQITETAAVAAGVTQFTATIEQPTKTVIDSEGKVTWNAGDEIVITDASTNSAVYVAESTGASTKFNLKDGQTAVGEGPYTATYGNINKQFYDAAGANCPLAAPETSGTALHFSSPYAVVRITAQSLGGESIKKVIVATSEWGYTLDCGSGVALTPAGTDFYVSLDADSYSKFSVTLFTDDEMVTKTRNGGATLAEKELLPVTFIFNPTDWKERHDFVVVKGVKWAVNNLAISASGKKPWKGIKAPGTDEDAIVGDYFQWAAYAGYCGNDTDPDMGLLVYQSFTNTFLGDATDAFVFKTGCNFNSTANAPYYSGSGYYKYDTDGETLEPIDDAANIILGGTWRIPTSAEHKALKDATYWAWDKTILGYYVHVPRTGDAGKVTTGSNDPVYDNADALLFIPGTGYITTKYNTFGARGFYWSSTCYSSTNAYDNYVCGISAYKMFNSQANTSRYLGCCIRPVSD